MYNLWCFTIQLERLLISLWIWGNKRSVSEPITVAFEYLCIAVQFLFTRNQNLRCFSYHGTYFKDRDVYTSLHVSWLVTHLVFLSICTTHEEFLVVHLACCSWVFSAYNNNVGAITLDYFSISFYMWPVNRM